MRGGVGTTMVLALASLAFAGCSGTEPTAEPLASGSSSPSDHPAAASGSLVGRVVNDEYAPVVGVVVSLVGLAHTGQTDEAGGFRLRAVPVGPQNVRFQAEGYVVLVRHVTVVADEALDMGSIELDRLPDGGSLVRIERLATKTARVVCAMGTPTPGVTALPKDDQCSKNNQLAGSQDPSLVTYVGIDLNFTALVIQGQWQKSSATARAPVLAFYLTGAVLETERTVERRLAWGDGTNDMGIEAVPGFTWILASKFVDKALWKNMQAPLRIRVMAADGNATLLQNPSGTTTEGSGIVLDQRVDLAVSLVYGTNKVQEDYDAFAAD